MGGDRDGNPFVTPETTRDVVIGARLRWVGALGQLLQGGVTCVRRQVGDGVPARHPLQASCQVPAFPPLWMQGASPPPPLPCAAR